MPGWLLGFIADFVVCMAIAGGWLGNVFHVIAKVLGGFVTFWLELPLIIALPGGSLILLGSGLVLGRNWSEWARGRYDANNSWNARNNYRTRE